MALPGEHGLHTRDGSLMKRKREQWEKEKAESSSWFPFGGDRERSSTRAPQLETSARPLGESSNSSGVRVESPGLLADYSSFFAGHSQLQASQTPSAGHSGQSSQFIMQTPFPGGSLALPACPLTPIFPQQFMTPQAGQASQYFAYQPIIQPTSQSTGQQRSGQFIGGQFNNQSNSQPTIMAHPFTGLSIPGQQLPVWPSPIPQIPAGSMLASNQFSVPTAALMSSTPMVTYSTTTTTATVLPAENSQQFPANGYRTVIAVGSSVDVITPPPPSQHQAQEQPAEQPKPQRSSIDAQIDERRRRDEQLAEQERRELETIRRDHEAQARQREREAAEKAERQRQLDEEMDAHQRAYQQNMERARIESEALRKAKLHKHRLLDTEVSQETVRQILGTDDDALIKKVLKELNELERQRRIDYENLNLTHSSSTSADKSHANHSHNQIVDEGLTPLSRHASGRASLRALPKSLAASRLPRRSGSAERANASTTLSRNATENRPSTSDAGTAPSTPTAIRRTLVPPQPMPRSSRTVQRPAASPSKLLKPTPAARSRTANVLASNSVADLTAGTGSTMSVCSSKTTILVGESPFAGQHPHIQSPGNSGIGGRTADKLKNYVSHGNKANAKALEPVSVLVNRSLPLADEDENNNNISPKSPSKYAFDRLEQLFIPCQPAAYDSLKQYEAIAANFHAVQSAAASPRAAASATAPFHAKAIHHLSELRTPPTAPPSNSSKSVGTQPIGLFEPVRTRNKVMRQHNDIDNRESGGDEFYGGTSYDGLDYGKEDKVAGLRPPAPSSMGASANLTSSDSSSASASPPLSNDCKSTSSSVENHGLHSALEANNERMALKSLNDHHLGIWRNSGASGSNEKLSDTTSGASSSSVERPTGGNENFAVPSIRRVGYSMRRFGATTVGDRPPASPFAKKLADTGLRRHPAEHPEVLRRNLQSPTMKHLQESLGNLSAAGGSPTGRPDESLSRPTTPKPFNCESIRYRSLNLKHRPIDRHQQIVSQLANVRAQLKERQLAIKQQVVVRRTDV